MGADICEHGIDQLSAEERRHMTEELHSLGFKSPFEVPANSHVRLRSASVRRRSYATHSPPVGTVAATLKAAEELDAKGGNHFHLSAPNSVHHPDLELISHTWLVQEHAKEQHSNGLQGPERVMDISLKVRFIIQ